MDTSEILKLAGGALALGLFVPMLLGVLKDGGAGQSFATWLLWAALDAILIFSLLAQHGNYLVIIGFAIGDTAMALALFIQGRRAWGGFETAILLAVAACLGVWWAAGPQLATVASTAGVCFGGLPGLIALWRQPNRSLGNLWAGYALANGLACLGGTAMTLEERFAPGVFMLFSLLMFAASRRRVTAAGA